ncbi:MAG: 7-cyano-7-deazaguanine synthase QueC [Candidatus Margulisbacteria bacterium]|nr:7-cyano-7-deazaguanine synthase QueC [Candidatus Margulisiibacteriota bacterium]
MNKPKSILLLSGGLDSAVSLPLAYENTQIVLALTFDYGQKAAIKEIQAAKLMAQQYGLSHKILKLDWLKEITKTALVDRNKKVPHLMSTELDDPEGKNLESALEVWVPNRNGIFINIAAAYAESCEAQLIITGFNWEEGQTFSDNTIDYINAVNGALSFSTQNLVEVKSYISELSKTEIVALGQEKKAPLKYIWSCYEEGQKMCGLCESCQRLKRALKENNLWDWFSKENLFI